jgi:hypothetical protein
VNYILGNNRCRLRWHMKHIITPWGQNAGRVVLSLEVGGMCTNHYAVKGWNFLNCCLTYSLNEKRFKDKYERFIQSTGRYEAPCKMKYKTTGNLLLCEVMSRVQTGRGTHTATYAMGTRSFPGVNQPGRVTDHPPRLSLRPWWPVLRWTLPLCLI